MAMHTGENDQGLRRILDMTRLMSIVLLALHFYYYCYNAFAQWQLTTTLTDRLLQNIQQTGLFHHFYSSKALGIAFLAISLLGVKGRKNETLSYKKGCAYILIGLLFYFESYLCIEVTAA